MRITLIASLALVIAAGVKAQDIPLYVYAGMTPQGLQPGAPAGSYVLSGFDTVNLYNGAISFNIPLVKIGGRGDAGYTISARVVNNWIESGALVPNLPTCPLYSDSPTCYYAQRTYMLGDWPDAAVAYRPAALIVRQAGQGQPGGVEGVGGCVTWGSTLTRIIVKFEDGTELELRDQSTGGNLKGPLDCTTGFNRGTVFVAADGSATTFIADAEIRDNVNYPAAGETDCRSMYAPSSCGSGFLYFRDGKQYRFDRGAISWIQDRHGNRTTFTTLDDRTNSSLGNNNWRPDTEADNCASRFQVTDSIGRITDVTIGCTWSFLTPSSGTGSYDEIVYRGPTATPGQPASSGIERIIKVYSRSYGWDMPAGSAWPTYEGLFPNGAGNGTGTSVGNVYDYGISRIEMPGSYAYTFQYTPYGEVSRVALPTGGAYEYDWANGPRPPGFGLNSPNYFPNDPELYLNDEYPTLDPDGLSTAIYRRVVERREYAQGGSGATGWTRKTDYCLPNANLCLPNEAPTDTLDPLSGAHTCTGGGPCSTVAVTDYDPVAGALGSQVHYFYGAASQGLFPLESTWYAGWLEGKEFRTDHLQANGQTLIQSEFQYWQQRMGPSDPGSPIGWWRPQTYKYDGTNGPEPALDPRLSQSKVGLSSATAAKTSKTYTYASDASDNSNNQLTVSEYDYDGISLIRSTANTYVSGAFAQPPYHLRSLVATTQIFNGAAAVAEGAPGMAAQTNYCYDESSGQYGSSPGPSLTCGSPTSPLHGDATTVAHWKDTAGGSWLKTAMAFDQYGNPKSIIDPLGHTTSASYGDCGVFLNSVTNAVGQTGNYAHDCSLGAITSETLHGFITTIGYPQSDFLDRPQQVVRDSGNDAQAQTSYGYSSDLLTVTSASDLYAYNDKLLETANRSDGLGRVVESRVYTSPGAPGDATSGTYIATVKTLEALGRTVTAYNPVCNCNSASGIPGTTSYVYDGLGRVSRTTYADGSFETSTRPVIDNIVLNTDAAGIQRQQTLDAAGRIAQIVEDPGGSTPHTTTYLYDALDNLLRVNQSSQTRTFAYDSLKELTSATNPEMSGPITYTYYDDGTLHTKALPGTPQVTVTYTYDGIHRVTSQSYSDGTPAVSYHYDGNSGGGAGYPGGEEGCMDSVTAAGVSTTLFAYLDPHQQLQPACGVTASTQTPSGQSGYPFGYQYTLAGQIQQETYPSGKIVSYHYDGANRVNYAYNGTSATPAFTYAGGGQCPDGNSGICYWAHGPTQTATFGNGIVESAGYNSRLQMTSMTAVNGNAKLLTLSYGYTAGANNGNLQSQVIANDAFGTESAFTVTQTYPSYDTLNRLTSFSEAGNSEAYNYDPYGNRWVTPLTSGSPYPNSNLMVTAQSQYDGATNRLILSGGQNCAGTNTSTSGNPYDDRGNLQSLCPFGLSYDGENRVVSAQGGGSGSGAYAYDGNGRRVQKVASGVTTTYVYDAFGNLAAEYSNSTSPTPPREYYTADHLGSTRLVTDGNGSVTRRYDYLPFGEGLEAGVNGRSTMYSAYNAGAFPGPASGDGEEKKFTGKERDAETGLDYFGARYMSSAQGRFVSPDWSAKPEAVPYSKLDDPQTLNLYGYVRNNPLLTPDLDGHGWWADFGNGLANSTYRPLVQMVSHPGDTVAGLGNAIAHPVDTVTAAGQAIMAIGKDALAGNGAAIGVAAGTVAMAVVPGAEEAEGAEAASAAAKLSNVEKIANDVEEGGFQVTANAKSATQEGNVTITHPNEPGTNLNLRVETHPLEPGGQPVRHANVEVIQRTPQNKVKQIKNEHITE